MENRFRIIALFTLIILNTNLIGQNWHWEWVEKQTKNAEDAWTEVIHTDFLNNIYCKTAYDTVIYISDTSFHHPNEYTTNCNSAISKYNDRGEFINSLDLYTFPGGSPIDPELSTDSALNIYLCSELFNILYINDTLITATTLGHPDVFLAKLTPDYNLLWSGLITSGGQDDLRGMVMTDDGFMYLSCIHYANFYPHQLNYLNQDTSAPYITPMNTLAKIDLDGNLVWKKEIRSEFLGTGTRDLIIGDDGLLYLTGTAYGHISIDNDTIYHPYYPEVNAARFLTVFSQQGEFIYGYFFDWDIWLWEIKVDSDGDMFVSGSISDTAIIGADTIIVPEGTYYKIIGKFDSALNPIWYHAFENNSSGRILLDNENILFTKNAKGAFQIADTILQLGNYYETIIGEFDEDGQLVNIISTNSSQDLSSMFNLSDNCTNIIIGGKFSGNAIFGNDTVNTSLSSIEDGFIAKLIRNESPVVELGPDSLYCKEFTISGPEGYQYYSWNDSITNQNSYTVYESRTIYFACSNEDGCWLYDTIDIEIHPGFEVELGSDTTIKENDTIVFFVPDQFESYLWSNGSTSNEITIIGSDFGIGTFPVWIEVADGPCIESDTILLTIKSEFGIYERMNNGINIFPNPFKDKLTIETKPDYQVLEICDLNGIIKYYSNVEKQNNKSMQIRTEKFQKGIYLLKIKTRKQTLFKKIIKI